MDNIQARQLRESSTVSFARSLFNAAEAKELFGEGFFFPSAVSAYYCLFHLGAALILAFCSENLDAGICVKVLNSRDNKARKKRHASANTKFSVSDPAEGVKHGYPAKFLVSETPGIAKALGGPDEKGTLMDMREFVSYAPRLLSDGRTTQLRSFCHYRPNEFVTLLDQHLTRINEYFHEAMQWLKGKSFGEVRGRLLRSDFILHEFDSLGEYHGESVRKGAGDIYCSLCEAEGIDWKVYRPDPDPGTWIASPEQERRRYQAIVDSWIGPA